MALVRVNRVRRRRTYKKKKTGGLVTFNRMKRYINRDVETKYYYRAITAGNIDSSAISTGGYAGSFPMVLNTMGNGVLDSERIGNSIKNVKLTFNYVLYNAGAYGFNFVRVIVFWARYATGIGTSPLGQTLDPTPADILRLPAGANYFYPSAEYSWSDKTKFQILYDRNHLLTNNAATFGQTGPGASVGGNPAVSVRKTINLKNKITEFDGSSSNSDQTKGALCLLMISNVPNSASTKPGYGWYSTLHFKDN